jgi:2-oxoglutarate ferredoxin oxidoreductase subunit delta
LRYIADETDTTQIVEASLSESTPRTKEALPRGFIKITEAECKGCALCIDACPQDALKLSDQLNRRGHRFVEQTDLMACTGCALCYIQCPSSAIAVYRMAQKAKRKT